MNTTITCIHCGKDIKLSDALSHELTEEREKIKKATEQETRKRLQEEFENKEKVRDKEIEEEKRKNKNLIEGLEKRKKEDEDKVREETAKAAAEKHRLEKMEWEKQKADQQKLIEELERKGKQGSQQLQGEVLELDLEKQLKIQFPQDEFLPVPKGVEGGDIWQKVSDKNGKLAGSILWETKRTKAWSPSWLPKLREDARKIGATECILISEALPSDVKSFHRKENVWISNYEYALHTARTIRFLILSIAAAKSAAGHNDDELRAIRDYITSDTFRHKFESHQESVKALKDDLTAEKRAAEIRWKKREIQIDRLDRNSSQMYVELQGIIGDKLPDIKTPDLLEELNTE